MLIVGITGFSDIGKTQLISSLVSILNKRGYKVGCIKHCPKGFEIDNPEKDSYKFKECGARGVILWGQDEIALLHIPTGEDSIEEVAVRYLTGCDFVLVEGFKNAKGINKIELIKKGKSQKPQVKESIALISDIPLKTGKKVFHPNDLDGITDLLEKLFKDREKYIKLKVNDREISLNSFVRKALKNTLLGFISALRRDEDKIKKIDISMEV